MGVDWSKGENWGSQVEEEFEERDGKIMNVERGKSD
jgi:hypothetical protein